MRTIAALPSRSPSSARRAWSAAGTLDRDAARARGEQEGVAGRDEQVLGDPARARGRPRAARRARPARGRRPRRRSPRARRPAARTASSRTRRARGRRRDGRRRPRSPGRAATRRRAPSRRRRVAIVSSAVGVVLDALALASRSASAGDELLGGEQRELEVLGAGPDGREHLLGVRRRQHEHDVLGRLLEALEQRVRRLLRQHVHLVEDVDGAVPAEALVRRAARAGRGRRRPCASTPRRSRRGRGTCPAAMARQRSHSPQGSPSSPRFVQFRALARIRAVAGLAGARAARRTGRRGRPGPRARRCGAPG